MDKEIKDESDDPDSTMNDDEDNNQDDVPMESINANTVIEEFQPIEMSEEDKKLVSKMTSLLENIEMNDDEEV
jgi:hypothetical protein